MEGERCGRGEVGWEESWIGGKGVCDGQTVFRVVLVKRVESQVIKI